MLLLAAAPATVTVKLDTVMGQIELELFDDVAKDTVTNFLNYTGDGDYNSSIIHRSVPGFVIQGGGFRLVGSSLEAVPPDHPIDNDFELSNLAGTIAMAKLGGDPDSATSQWFINLADNADILDGQNGGFTVFGKVSKGMDVVEDIAALPICEFVDPFAQLPLINYTTCPDPLPTRENFVVINQVIELPEPPELLSYAAALVTLIWLARRRRRSREADPPPQA